MQQLQDINMKLIGFIKGYEENLGGAFFEEIQEVGANDPELITSILAYLDKRKLVMAWIKIFYGYENKGLHFAS